MSVKLTFGQTGCPWRHARKDRPAHDDHVALLVSDDTGEPEIVLAYRETDGNAQDNWKAFNHGTILPEVYYPHLWCELPDLTEPGLNHLKVLFDIYYVAGDSEADAADRILQEWS